MLKRLKIRNYRAFRELEIGEMARINLVTGGNNSGKTTLLEAVFLLAGGGNPKLALNTTAIRGIDSFAGPPEAIREALWTPLFSELDLGRTVEISGDHASLGPLTLEIRLAPLDRMELPLDTPGALSHMASSRENALSFTFHRGGEAPVSGRMRIAAQGMQVDLPSVLMPLPGVLLSSRIGSLEEDARRLGQLRRRKQEDLVVDALRIIEPDLGSIESNMATGNAMIWGDVGLAQLVPLPVMGEGMTRVARLVLAISEASGGVVLMDEVESGLHHTVLPEIWRVLDGAARKFDTQIIATTHSFECVEAAQRALPGNDFRLHRLEITGGENRGITYRPDAAAAAVEHNLEVR